ncbi:hypothetical protein lbkm_3413 [Lachnospiraceae bacterium KM106-2]|nr:hypothetical protein lbkm_3413 [Lachnospiraceae bacterium KM106-2]
MKEKNILTCGEKELGDLKNLLLSLDEQKEFNTRLELEESQIEHNIESKEKEQNEEIQLTIKKRLSEITATYEEQINRRKNKIKKVKNKKEKHKSVKVSERIAAETASLCEENDSYYEETKKIYKENHILPIFNNRFYYAIYSPRGVSDFGIIALTLLLILLAIPMGIYEFLAGGKGVAGLVAIYAVDILAAGGLYFYIATITKQRYPEVIERVKQIRLNIRRNKKQINNIKKQIRKDKDESIYGLEEYDKQIRAFEEKIEQISKEKKKAIQNFEEVTREIITNEIKERYTPQLQELRKSYDEKIKESRECEEKIDQMMMLVANDYEAYMGKELLNCNTIDQLLTIMQEKSLGTVSEAIQNYQERAS